MVGNEIHRKSEKKQTKQKIIFVWVNIKNKNKRLILLTQKKELVLEGGIAGLTSCKILRKRISCFLKESTSCIIVLRNDLSSMKMLSSELLIESRPIRCGDGRCGGVLRLKLSRDRGLSEPGWLPCCIRDRFNRRVARAGNCDL